MTRPPPPAPPSPVGPTPPPLDRFPRAEAPWELLLIEVPNDADILQTLRLLTVEELPESPPPLLLVIADPNEEAIRAFSPAPASLPPDALQGAILHNLYDAIVQPMAPCQATAPPALLVEDASLQKLLREPLLGWGIPVRRVEGLSAWSFLPELLDRLFSAPPDSMVSGAAHEEQALCALAARLAALKPWLHLQETQFLVLDSDDVPITHPIASFWGSQHQVQGVIFYRAVEAVAAAMAQWPIGASAELGVLPSTQLPFTHDAIALMFARRRELAPEMRDAFSEHDLPVHRDLFPRFLRTRPQREATPLQNPGECLTLTAVLEALCTFLETHMEDITRRREFPLVEQTVRVSEGWEVIVQSSPPAQQRFFQILQHFSPPPLAQKPKGTRGRRPTGGAAPAKAGTVRGNARPAVSADVSMDAPATAKAPVKDSSRASKAPAPPAPAKGSPRVAKASAQSPEVPAATAPAKGSPRASKASPKAKGPTKTKAPTAPETPP